MILHKKAYALRKQKLAQSDENECEHTHPGADDPKGIRLELGLGL
jgi:hypothetical protein